MQQASSPIPATPVVATPESRRPGKAPRSHTGETLAAYLFLAPYAVVLGVFTIFAVLYGFYLSFFRVDIGFGVPEFIGLRNYQAIWNQLFFQGGVGDFWLSMINIVKYVVIVVIGQTVVALILALLLNRIAFLKGVFRTIFYLPSVTSSIAVSLIFLYLYTPQGGINYLFSLVGITGPHWLEDPNTALISIVFLNIWTTAPTFMIFYLGALQGLPTQLYEAAEVDGAGPFQVFWNITLPLLRPVTFLIVALGTIGAFQVFDQIIIMTMPQGGPLKSTLTPVVEMYLTGFRDNKFGFAAAMSVILFIFVFLVTMIQRSLIDTDIQY